ncbi:hypothetical protein C8Q76DRAFT_801243 [Earliella scabrosa]|nr:hypothetical protein C8Q76DRAFT_801243 [Earliella scabrosa]
MSALHKLPVILHNDRGVTCKTLICGGQAVSDHGRDVHLLVVEYGVGLYAFLVCALAAPDACDDPPVVLWKTLIPDKRVVFSIKHAHYVIFVAQEDNQYSLEFHRSLDFWLVVRNISQAQCACDSHEKQVDRLLDDALNEVCKVAARDRASALSLD